MEKSHEDTCLSLDLNSDPVRNSVDSLKLDSEGYLDDEIKSPVKEDQSDRVVDQLNRMKLENKKLTEMLLLVCENYKTLQNHMMNMMQEGCGSEEISISRKRKFEAENSLTPLGNDASNDSTCPEGSPKRPKEIRTNISRVFVRVDPADTSLVVKDGYHWRKYGQKVTKDNPSPRAYFKCTFAPTCQVKKKVQRSVGDPWILVATYEGEHNHQHPLQAEMLAASTQSTAALPLSPAAGTNCLDCLVSRTVDSTDIQRYFPGTEANAAQKLMVEKMAASLTRNPSFTAALVAAISGRILSHDPSEK